jgi:hypothetical protein
MNDYPKPPFPKQGQPVPGSQKKMDPYPDCGEHSSPHVPVYRDH